MKIPPNRCNAKRTLDTQTGIIYPSFKQACDELGLNLQQERLHRHRLYYFERFIGMDEWEPVMGIPNFEMIPEEELRKTRNNAYKYLIE